MANMEAEIRRRLKRIYDRHTPLLLAMALLYHEVSYATEPIPWYLRAVTYGVIAAFFVLWAEQNYRSEEVAG